MSYVEKSKIKKVKSSNYYQDSTLNTVTIDEMSLAVDKIGEYRVDFNTQFNTALANITEQAVIDLNDLFLDLNNETVGSVAMPSFATGTTINSGVYSTAAAISATGTITFDGGGDEDSIFIFKSTAGAFTAGAGCVFNLINGANAGNIFFLIYGAITLSAGSNTSGIFIGNAAVTVGAGAFLNGSATTRAGAISNSGNINVPVIVSQFPMGLINTFAIFSSNGALTNTGSSVIVGDIGTHLGTITGFGTVSLSGYIYYPSQGASLVTVSFYVNSAIQTQSTRERTSIIAKEDIVITDYFNMNEGDTLTVKVTNSIGISRFYNRCLIITELSSDW